MDTLDKLDLLKRYMEFRHYILQASIVQDAIDEIKRMRSSEQELCYQLQNKTEQEHLRVDIIAKNKELTQEVDKLNKKLWDAKRELRWIKERITNAKSN